jgi:hypothetical protein
LTLFYLVRGVFDNVWAAVTTWCKGVYTRGMDTVGRVMQDSIAEVHKLAVERDDARASLVFWEVKLRLAAVAAIDAQVPKNAVAAAAKISRPTLDSWIQNSSVG